MFSKPALIFFALVVGLGSAFVSQFASQRDQVRQQAEREAFYADPDVVAILDATRGTCPQQSPDFLWVCGVVLSLPHSKEDGPCSSPDEPWFVGQLEFNDMSGASLSSPEDFHIWRWTQSYALPDGKIAPCRGGDCLRFSISGDYTHPRLETSLTKPPSERFDLPVAEPVFTDDGFVGHWASVGGHPVQFIQPPDASNTRVNTKHPDLPIRIGLVLPKENRNLWSTHLNAVFDLVSTSVVSVATRAQCTEPPVSSKFHVDSFDEALIRQVRDWRRARMD